MKTYEQTLDWLYSLEKSKGIELKLERVARGLQALGNPQAGLRCFHVAGTNGKGSVVAYLDSVLRRAGYRVGAYTSPHLVELTERIRVGGAEIPRSEVVRLTDEICRRVIDAGIELTFFEVVTAMAFLHFERVGVDYAAVEVGLGGRLDATNLVDPMVSVITTIGSDHGQYLGTSERQIAAEKGGIVKAGRPLVAGRLAPPAREVIEAIAADRGAPVYLLGRDFTLRRRGGALAFEGLGWKVGDLQIGLAGAHQEDNAAVALAAIAALGSRRPPLADDIVARGLREVAWPGRLETVLESPRTILDGAHNVEAMRALVAALAEVKSGGVIHVLFAAMGDKDWPQMIETLGPSCASAVVTEVIPERAVAAAQLSRAFSAYCPTVVETVPAEGLRRVRALAKEEDTVLVTGSLFLVGAIHEILSPPADAAE